MTGPGDPSASAATDQRPAGSSCSSVTLRTLGHATMVVEEDGVPVLATDPWITGSVYWRSWWLDQYPSEDDVERIRSSRYVYITHSHPDHLHWPSLRSLGTLETLHPDLPHYRIPELMRRSGFGASVLEPWRWYSVSDSVEVASVPVPLDDSILVVRTPFVTVCNLNDSNPRKGLLRAVRKILLSGDRPVIGLRSYSPASSAVATFRNGVRSPLRTTPDYARLLQDTMAEIGAGYCIPFASQAFYNREDSAWANEHKVRFDDLVSSWQMPEVELCPPYSVMTFPSRDREATYAATSEPLSPDRLETLRGRQESEARFEATPELRDALASYMDDLAPARLLYRRGIVWRLTPGGTEYFWDPRRRTVTERTSDEWDLCITLPGLVLSDALRNGVLTDIGISMFVRVDTRVGLRRTYLFFLLMGLHDYGHLESWGKVAETCANYLPYAAPTPAVVHRWRSRSRQAPQAVIGR